MKKLIFAMVSVFLCICIASPAFAIEQVSSNTVLYDDSKAMLNNIDLALDALDGVTIKSEKTFSFNDAIGPRTKAKGYAAALNGRASKVIGGGVAQVAATLHLAAKKTDGVSILEKHLYGKKFAWDHVDSKDAILVDFNADKDYRFKNNSGKELRIAARREADTLYCMIYPADSDEPEKPDEKPEPDNESPRLFKVYRCKEYINLRKTASTSSKSIAQIPLDATVLVLKTGGKLHKVKYDGLAGYVNSAYVKAVPKDRIRKVDNCNEYISLREQPSSTAKRLAKLRLGTLVLYLGDADNGFTKVQHESQTGYALRKYLEKPK
ncbi:MAG: VanW family protein [Clostridia bacterium]